MPDLVLHGRKLGRFVVHDQIAEGGCGVLYRCAQPLLERDAVVKVLHGRRRDDHSAQQRFMREAQLASRLDHPYAAHIYDFGVEPEDGLLWIAMELVPGITLDAWLREHGPMPLEQFVPLFECLADVVQCAHERGIIHRDLKPSNVMVIERGGRLIPKLLDLGIAKVSQEIAPMTWPEGSLGENCEPTTLRGPDGMTRTDSMAKDWRLTPTDTGIGSAAYMAPEQWDNASAVGPASDIYSLGVLIYRALSGRFPFTAHSEVEYQWCHRHAEVPPLGGNCPPAVERIVQRALAKLPGDRHPSVLELASELRAALQASERELLRSLAQQWEARARPPALLLSGDVLASVDRWTRHAPTWALSKLECSFLTTSQRRVRRAAHSRRIASVLGATLTAGIALGVLQYRGEMRTRLAQEQTRSAQRVTEATITQAELEQGRSASLHGEPDALLHLAEAYRRGDHAPGTTFMLARAMQPRLAEQARLPSSFGPIWSAAFSPDGTQIVTTDDRNAQLWDAQTYQRRFELPHGSEVYNALYSTDGTRLVTVAQDAVRVWDPTRGRLVRTLSRPRGDGKPSDYYVAVLSSNGKRIAAIDAAGSRTHVWDTATGAAIAELSSDGLEFPNIAFSHDDRWFAVTGGNNVRVFDTRTWRIVTTIHEPRIHRLAFDPVSPRLVTGAATGDVSLWEIPSGTRTRHLREIGAPVDALAFSPDGKLVAAGSNDGAEQVWRGDTGTLQAQLNPRHSRIVAVEFDRASKLVLAAGVDGSVVVADATLGIPVTVLESSRFVIRGAHFDPAALRVIGASRDGTARVWNATAPYLRWSSPPIDIGCGVVTMPEPDRRFIAVGCKDHPTLVWDTQRGQRLAELPSSSHVEGDFISTFPAVSTDGDRAAIARGPEVAVYELPGSRLLRTIAHGAPVSAIAFSPIGQDIVSGAVDGSLSVTRDNGARLVLPTHAADIDAVALSPDGRILASDAHRRLRVYDPRGAILADLELPMRVMALRIDGDRLVTIPTVPPSTGSVASPLLLDLQSYRIIARLDGHIGRVFSARWVDEHQILTAGIDGTARLWNGTSGQLQQTYRGGTRLLDAAILSSEGLVIAGDADGQLRFWDRAGHPLWNLQAHNSMIIGIHVEDRDIVTRGFNGELARWKLPLSESLIKECSALQHCTIDPP
ncbi:MAG TPA: protein kinase [Kofleriaceae bacterium]|nr:protein kinase [Kofleriaceae bacterium]